MCFSPFHLSDGISGYGDVRGGDVTFRIVAPSDPGPAISAVLLDDVEHLSLGHVK